MRRLKVTTTIATYGVLILAGGASFLLPRHLGIGEATADGSPAIVRLPAVVRDFQPKHPDFDVDLSDANGHIVGLVGAALNSNGLPAYDGSGNLVLTAATDSKGRSIAPIMASLNEGVEFDIVNGKVIVSEPFAAMITIVGAAMNSGSYEMPVTVRMNVGTTAIDPFGDFTKAIAGNVNKAGNPRQYISQTTYAANTPIYVTGRSWTKKQSSYNGTSESHWQTFYEFNTNAATQQIKVLRNGDSAPNTAGFLSQLAAKEFLLPYIDPVTQKVVLYDNQVIYLFELGTTNMSAASADFQDVVAVITMAKSPQAFDAGISQADACGPGDDNPAKLDPTPSTGAIGSADTFKHWFSNALGSNLADASSIDLVRQSDDSYLFDDTIDPRYKKRGGFFPAHGQMFADKGSNGHNTSFTYQFEARFVYDESIEQFFEVLSDMEIWVYIDDKLVIDLGGFHGPTEQRIDLSRLCLTDGKDYKLSFFLASRYAPQSSLRIHTNLEFIVSNVSAAVTSGHD